MQTHADWGNRRKEAFGLKCCKRKTFNPKETIMRKFTVLVMALAFSGLMLGQQAGHVKPAIKVISEKDIAEKVDGKDSKAAMVEVTLEAGQSSPPHRHPGPVFGYVLEGDYEWGLNDLPVKLLKVGDTFYEPTGSLHRVSRNPGKTRTRILATLVVPRDAKGLSTPEPAKK
jgi:quercetin dioxygenase-like cupin family protein